MCENRKNMINEFIKKHNKLHSLLDININEDLNSHDELFYTFAHLKRRLGTEYKYVYVI